jgi:Mg2+/Co2+ transporter CorC
VLKLELPEHEGFTTIAGFLMAQAGRLLNEGDSINYNGHRFTVEHLEGRRIRRVRFHAGVANADKPDKRFKQSVIGAMLSILSYSVCHLGFA